MPKKSITNQFRVAVIAFDGISPFHLSVPSLVFCEKHDNVSARAITVTVCAVASGIGPHSVTTNAGFTIQTKHGLNVLRKADLIIMPSWRDDLAASPQLLLDALRNAHQRGTRIVGLCLGAFVLAEAGLLEQRTATTHWAAVKEFQSRFPGITVDPDVLFVDQGSIITSAGTAAGLDCCLHVLRSQFGSEIASHVARRLVLAPHRQGGQAQYIEQPVPSMASDERLSEVIQWMLSNIAEPLNLDRLAQLALMSRRSFTRHFQQLTGTSAGKWLLNQRIIQAQRQLEMSQRSIEEIAINTGFGSALMLRRYFARYLQTSPSAYRREFQGT